MSKRNSLLSFDYWKMLWDNKSDIAYNPYISPNLRIFWKDLCLYPGNRMKVLVPLCGKTLDMIWMASQNCTVVGIEYYDLPIKSFFEENNITYTSFLSKGKHPVYKSLDKRITIYYQDFFTFELELNEEKFDAVWDRGSMVAIQELLRPKYVNKVLSLLKMDFRWLIESVYYDKTKYSGPPKSISNEEFEALVYENKLKFKTLQTRIYEEKLGDAGWANEQVTLFEPCLDPCLLFS